MTTKSTFVTAIAAAVAFTVSAAASAHERGDWPGRGGPGMMGQGMNPGMMSQGMNPGMMQGPCPMGGQGMMQGHGMMQGRGMMQGQGMMGGHGMMGGQGSGMMGSGMMGAAGMAALRQDLTVDEVRHILGHHIEWQGNPNLKLGTVEETDEDTITAEIVTRDDSLVRRLEINRHTGQMRPAG
ncbi:hypothetical protein [Minwuia thermotolerans]|uniref:PepSY domain-containing protein n=1 Tax=Minwuia thermotolerans TaxID=2056226 RepID=A0A2M9G001_9PROT|nr:hypothetical protein [Minwuia thermotolerans]PJK29036.1 hypothetical protein CVT23_14040 [Minwuia thermotolerans]